MPRSLTLILTFDEKETTVEVRDFLPPGAQDTFYARYNENQECPLVGLPQPVYLETPHGALTFIPATPKR